MSYDASLCVAWAKTQVGFKEGPNNRNPYSLWQYGNAYNPWCASFQCQAQYEGGYRFENCTYGERGEAYTPTEAARAKQQGTWREKQWRSQPGDAVLFDWGNNGLIDHVELVVVDDGTNIVTIGGNTSDAVLYRKRDRKYVAGFWALSQSHQAKPPLDPEVLAAIKKLLEWGKRVTEKPLRGSSVGHLIADSNNDVAILNRLLHERGLLANTSMMNTYTKHTRNAVHHFKKLAKLSNTTGHTFGGEAVAAILKPR